MTLHRMSRNQIQPYGPRMRFFTMYRLERVAAVPRHEELDAVAVGHDEAGREHDLGHVLQVPHRDEVLEPEHLAERDRRAS